MRFFLCLCFSVVMFANVAFGTDSGSANVNNNNNNISIDDSNKAISNGQYTNYGGGSITQNFESSIQLPGTLNAQAVPPTLFAFQGLPAQVTGIPLLSRNFFSTVYHEVSIGCSKGTKIIYNGAKLPKRGGNDKRIVACNFNGIAKGEVVGSITIQSRKDRADEVDVPTLLYDAVHFVNCVHELKGYNLTLLSIPNTITYASGVDARGSGFSISPLLSGLFEMAHMMGGVAAGYSRNGGVTVPTAIVGCTFLIVAETDNSGIVNIASAYSRPAEPAPVVAPKVENTGNGMNGNSHGSLKKKKYEAAQAMR
ncbi:MAG: hypothetical protein FDX30_08100 [Chlorobium sp.]|nr:MAG: hypothetical protein FDX30_08100 [Chlorobium sp.]